MTQLFSLILAVLIPSWRFFETVEPSPRVQWAYCTDTPDWHNLSPRPAHVPLWRMIARLFWNPQWNAALFITNCAERIEQGPDPHAVLAIQDHISQRISWRSDTAQFRLLFVQGKGDAQVADVSYISAPFVRPKA